MAVAEHTKRKALLATKYIDMESPVHDVADMAKIADILMERVRNEIAASIKAGWPADDLERHLQEFAAPAAFAVAHLHSMAIALRETYTQTEAG